MRGRDSDLARDEVRPQVEQRVRRFAVLRAAERALTPSSRSAVADREALRWIRERLRQIFLDDDAPAGAAPLEPERVRQELDLIDGALDGYASTLVGRLETVPVPQLRASLSVETAAQRKEALALLEMCLDAESRPARLLHVVDFLLTLLSTVTRDGTWFLEVDPADLNDAVRQRCAEAASVESGAEAKIVARFQWAAEKISESEDCEDVLREMSAYKKEIASFLFVPSVLRCVVGYNTAARNHFAARMQRSREIDQAIDDEIGLFDPAVDEIEGAEPAGLRAHEHPGVVAVADAVARRLEGRDGGVGPASRIAADLDLSILSDSERSALVNRDDEATRLVRMTVLLGHLAMMLPDSPGDFAALGLRAEQLDAWICALGETVQQEINDRLREDYGSAFELGDTKSRFLTAVLLVARRRREPGRRRTSSADDEDTFMKDAVEIVREYLLAQQIQQQKAFVDLMGGGWRRTLALSAALLVVAWIGFVQLLPTGSRPTYEFSEAQARRISPLLESAYRDHASEGSLFVAVASDEFMDLSPPRRRETAEKILGKLAERGVEEFLIYDRKHSLVARFKGGRWRNQKAFE